MRTLIVMLAVGFAAPSFGDPLGVGDSIAPFTIEDQHHREHRIDAGVTAILFTRDMEAGNVAKQALKDRGKELLEAAGTVYLADVSAMPALIRRIFAEPSMRRRGYPMLLDRDGSLTGMLPSTEGHATVLLLDGLRITHAESLASAEAITKCLEALAGDAPPS